MRRRQRIVLALGLGFLCAGFLTAELPKTEQIEAKDQAQTSVTDKGAIIKPLAVPAGKTARVLLFTTVDCPIANAYVPRLQRLEKEYQPKGISFVLVHVDPEVDWDAARAHAEQYRIRTTLVRDPRHQLVASTGAAITPEAVVIGKDGAILYRGRIDDWYTALGQRRAKPRTHDLVNALDAILEGKKPAANRTEAVGCYIADFLPPK